MLKTVVWDKATVRAYETLTSEPYPFTPAAIMRYTVKGGRISFLFSRGGAGTTQPHARDRVPNETYGHMLPDMEVSGTVALMAFDQKNGMPDSIQVQAAAMPGVPAATVTVTLFL